MSKAHSHPPTLHCGIDLGVQLSLAYEHLARGHKNVMVSVGWSGFRLYFEILCFVPGSVLSAHQLPARTVRRLPQESRSGINDDSETEGQSH